MENTFLVGAIISFIYFIGKFLEMRYIDTEPKPLKILIRDTLLVFVSVIIGGFVIDQVKPVINEIKDTTVPLAFTDNPPF